MTPLRQLSYLVAVADYGSISAAAKKLSRKDLIRKLLKGIETGDPEAATVVNEAVYIQHNPQTHEGSGVFSVTQLAMRPFCRRICRRR